MASGACRFPWFTAHAATHKTHKCKREYPHTGYHECECGARFHPSRKVRTL